MTQKRISIKDIARLSGVSIATVSRVLNGKGGGYSQKTADKIMAIANSYGYVSNMAAKSLRESKSHTIGLIVPDISNDFFSTLAFYIENIMAKHSYSVFICNTGNKISKEKEYFRTLIGKGVDGIICSSGLNLLTDEVIFNNLPIVCIDRYSENSKHILTILNDELHGSFIATEHLIKKGCKNILFLGFHTNNPDYLDREKGYLQALATYDMFQDKNYILYRSPKYSSCRDAEELVTEFLKTGLPLDGIFASNDHLALGALYSLQHHGYHVPNDVQIVGFDNSLYSRLPIPSISTIERNPQELASKGCDALIQLMNGKTPETFNITVPVQLVERESTK